MSRASFVLFLMIGVLCSTTIAQTETQCPVNQEYKECGSACPPSCNNPDPQLCTMQCVQGCQCKDGLLLKSSGECVPSTQC
ncbi:chymotrypsin inhibitor-like [Temnothorax curvispinosus]|uniref:Chymotrypsin inhibitor-like n=1 Tax=Temnothorax curvispinosus TaxID=300111 RepID=A0A6J1PZB4_9HYME|nr:chymotrypsin inhibitor-like [Temnothorax curvispinosus]